MSSFRKFLDDLLGPTPIVHSDIPHNEQNDEVFNSENSPPQDHMVDDSVNPFGVDPFYGVHTQTVEEVTGHQAEVAHKDFQRGMAELEARPHLLTRRLPSASWGPRTVTMVNALPLLLEYKDPHRVAITVLNASGETVYLSAEQISGPAPTAFELPNNVGITVDTQDTVYLSCPTASDANPVSLSYFTESDES